MTKTEKSFRDGVGKKVARRGDQREPRNRDVGVCATHNFPALPQYPPEDLAEHFCMPVQQVLEIVEAGNLLSEDGTIDLISYTAFLNGEEPHVK